MIPKKAIFFMIAWVAAYYFIFTPKAHSSETNTIRCEYNAGNNEFTKTVTTDSSIVVYQVFRGIRGKVFIKDVNALSESEDYIILKKGDKSVLFSLKCQKL